ncbi:MAG TPA: leucine-rich repeat domain-containing protein [Ruminococcus bromii]|nr:leucine-rich repeat domain-containing protein [Ruminococcus bromii]
MGASVFNGSKITEVTIPSSIKQIEDYAFSSCHSLTKVNLSEGLEILNNSVFFNCSELREIKLPSTLKEIGPSAFSGAALNNVVLPDSGKLTKIDEYAFYQSRELTDITIPACITSIPDNVFAECSKEVTIHGASGSYAQNYAKKNNLKFKADLGSSSTKVTKASGKAAEKAE